MTLSVLGVFYEVGDAEGEKFVLKMEKGVLSIPLLHPHGRIYVQWPNGTQGLKR